MPKLNKTEAKTVNETETMDYSPVDPGIYPLRLLAVEQKDGKEYPYWSVQYGHENPPDHGKKQFTNLSKSPKAAFKMKEFFDAHEVPSTTDTDEMCGTVILGLIKKTTIKSGEREGDPTNEIVRLMPYDESKIDCDMGDGDDTDTGDGESDFD